VKIRPRPALLIGPALALAAACAAPADDGTSGGGGAGGKADDPAACGDGRTCLEFASYDVLFTNPVCQLYEYEQPVAKAGGSGELTAKPKNVWCTIDDTDASGAREQSPQFRLVEWISELGADDEVFLAYLSYSNPVVGTALCEAIGRGAEVTMVLDAPSTRSAELEACGGTVLLRGHQGSIEFAHDKFLLINPDGGSETMRMSFSSGNMSSGAVLHHENWHFIDVARESFFAEAHRCLRQALLDPDHTDGKGNFRAFMNSCRAAITFPEEDDIRSFFIPALDDSRGITELLVERVGMAATIDIGVHRLGLTELVDALAARLEDDEDFRVRLIADDDLYWLNPLVGEGAVVGSNLEFEADNVERLAGAGGDFAVKYMETNHGLHLLHHNKFLVLHDMPDLPDAVICGAANLTGTGFDSNLENIYYVEIPQVVEAFETQFARFWDGTKGSPDEDDPPRATAPEDMPAENIAPP
jgi:hypothetical protein